MKTQTFTTRVLISRPIKSASSTYKTNTTCKSVFTSGIVYPDPVQCSENKRNEKNI